MASCLVLIISLGRRVIREGESNKAGLKGQGGEGLGFHCLPYTAPKGSSKGETPARGKDESLLGRVLYMYMYKVAKE